MSANEDLLRRFYTAFSQKDAATMGACYHERARFSDPVFQDLDAVGVRRMWAMLVKRGRDLTIEVDGIRADDSRGEAHWIAHYTFSGTGRPVRNDIRASFEFSDGSIIRHVDRFDLWRWSAMALGLKGTLLGWTGPVQKAIRTRAAKSLAEFRG